MARSYLVCDIRADVLQSALAGLVCQLRRVLAYLLPFCRRLFRQIDAIHRSGAGLEEGEGHLEAQSAVASGYEGNPVGKRELMFEERA